MPIRCQSERLGLIQMHVGTTSSQKVVIQKKNSQLTLCVVQFHGTAVIDDPQSLETGIRSGIGHGRMLGLGLFSIAPIVS